MTSRRFTFGALAVAILSTSVLGQSGYVPERVFVSAKKQFADFEVLLGDAARADVLFVGEQHDDANTHRLELAVLEGLARRGAAVVLSLEMFERDVQEPLGHFLMGHLSEEEFLHDARPWPKYRTDYKPLVDFAVSRQWPVIAANVPRAIAAEVSRGGLKALDARPDAERAWFARDLRCPTSGPYYERFKHVMTGHDPSAPADRLPADVLDRYYHAQCVKDETMAESMTQAYAAGRAAGGKPVIVSINGAFHTDSHGLLVEGVQRRLPRARLVVLSILPVADLDRVTPAREERGRADYLIYTIGRPAESQALSGRRPPIASR